MAGVRRVSMACMAAFAALSSPAAAQGVDDLRRAFVARAEAARDAGDHAAALDLAERAAALRETPSLALFAAQEAAALGRDADALGHARRCAADAAADAALRNRDRILRLCDAIVRELAPRVPPAARVEPPAPPVVAVPPVLRPRPSALPAPLRPAPAPAGGTGAGPWILAGAGALALGAAAVLWVARGDAIADRDARCGPLGCTPSARDADDRARALTVGTNVALGVGGAALAAGAAWFVAATVGRPAPVRPVAWVLPSGGAVVGVGGAL